MSDVVETNAKDIINYLKKENPSLISTLKKTIMGAMRKDLKGKEYIERIKNIVNVGLQREENNKQEANSLSTIYVLQDFKNYIDVHDLEEVAGYNALVNIVMEHYGKLNKVAYVPKSNDE